MINRLSTYLARLLTRESAALLGVMLGLLFLVQCLKIFDVVVVQGQNLPTLLGQAALGMPPLAIVIAYVCMGIGMVRGLGALQASHELHIIHTNRQLRSLFGGIGLFALGGAVVVLTLSNFVEPWSTRRLADWSASIAADVVGRTLTPHRFSQVVTGVTMVIGSRQGIGNLTDFFSDDRRDPTTRRTYSAKTAKLAADAAGYILELHDGTLQYYSADKAFSEVAFKTYDIPLDKLTDATGSRDPNAERSTVDIVAQALADHGWAPEVARRVYQRLAEGLRALSMCVFMAGLTAFPNGRRRRSWFPLELLPLFVAYADKGITENLRMPIGIGQFAGPLTVLAMGLLILLLRLKPFRRPVASARLA